MGENLEVYDLKGNFVRYQDISDFYKNSSREFFEKGFVSYKVKTVSCILFDTKGRVILQKRSYSSHHGPGLYDKSVGGHVSAGETPDIAIVKESLEELGVVLTILSDLDKAVERIDIERVGVVEEFDYIEEFYSKRELPDLSYFYQPVKETVYLGVYDGDIRFEDGEVEDYMRIELSSLLRRVKHSPEEFTYDLIYVLKKYGEDLKKLSERIVETKK